MLASYWGLCFRNLDKRRAKRLLRFGSRLGFEGFTSDPRSGFDAIFDPEEARVIGRLLAAGLEMHSGPLEDRDKWGGESLLDTVREWLEFARKSSGNVWPSDFDRWGPRGWGVELIGLTEAAALELSEKANELGVESHIIDPANWLELGLDRGSVGLLLLFAGEAIGRGLVLTNAESERAAVILRSLKLWMEQISAADHC